VRQRLASLCGFQREVAVQTWARLRCDTRVPLQARDSHPVADDPWCTGTAQATDANTRHSLTPPTPKEICMSRYRIPAQDPGLTAIVGWDNPLTTFFAEVVDPSIEEDEEAYVLWIGTEPEAIPTVAALQARLAGWATIPAEIVDRLTRDQQAATPPTPLQRWALQCLHGTGAVRSDRP
jgi:hypothetical protein